MAYLVIGLGGVFGANARYLVAEWATRCFGVAFPYGTFHQRQRQLRSRPLHGLHAAIPGAASPSPLLRRRLLGAYTTFSAFSFELLQLVQNGRFFVAFAYILGSTMLGLLGAWLGFILGKGT